MCSGQTVLTLSLDRIDYVSLVVSVTSFYFFVPLYKVHFLVLFRGLWLYTPQFCTLNESSLRFITSTSTSGSCPLVTFLFGS